MSTNPVNVNSNNNVTPPNISWLTQFIDWLNNGANNSPPTKGNGKAAQKTNLLFQQNAESLFGGNAQGAAKTNNFYFPQPGTDAAGNQFYRMLYQLVRIFPFLQWFLPFLREPAGDDPVPLPEAPTDSQPEEPTVPPEEMTPPPADDPLWLQPKNGKIVLKGTAKADEISLHQDPTTGDVYAMVNGKLKGWIKKEDFEQSKIEIQGGKGNDKIDISALGAVKNGITLYGGAGADTLIGSTGDDVFHGGAGKDDINAGAGNDTIYGGKGKDKINSGTGDDKFVNLQKGELDDGE